MSVARLSRNRKRQLGQYLTPESTAAAIVRSVDLSPGAKILEPSFGEGSFVFQIIDSLASALPRDEIHGWCRSHLYGCEIDDLAYRRFTEEWRSRGLGEVPSTLEHCDFFTWLPPGCDRTAATNRKRYYASHLEHFDLIIGNPPFGGTIDPNIQDDLDAIFGVRNLRKIKKETYAFFIVKSVDLLKPGGKLVFICSDTILTIPTMTGLRNWLQETCDVRISRVPGLFSDTNQDMVLLTIMKEPGVSGHVTAFGKAVPLSDIESTPNMSWRVDPDLVRYFTGATIGDTMVATSGMTIGKNELFLRRIESGLIREPYEFRFAEQPITVERELSRARLGRVPARRLREVQDLEERGATERVVEWSRLDVPKRIAIPHEDYCYYNKASSRLVHSDPEWVVFWRGHGEYVYTFKKTGNWYLRGVGGMKHFGREGLTWALIAPRLYARYLPPGYILDSGAPCAFLRDGVDHDELFFILGWALTDQCNHVLKTVLNHTRNIQSKDFERLPYPVWVDAESREQAVVAVRDLLTRARDGESFSPGSHGIKQLNDLYQWRESHEPCVVGTKERPRQLPLLWDAR